MSPQPFKTASSFFVLEGERLATQHAMDATVTLRRKAHRQKDSSFRALLASGTNVVGATAETKSPTGTVERQATRKQPECINKQEQPVHEFIHVSEPHVDHLIQVVRVGSSARLGCFPATRFQARTTFIVDGLRAPAEAPVPSGKREVVSGGEPLGHAFRQAFLGVDAAIGVHEWSRKVMIGHGIRSYPMWRRRTAC